MAERRTSPSPEETLQGVRETLALTRELIEKSRATLRVRGSDGPTESTPPREPEGEAPADDGSVDPPRGSPHLA